MGRLLLVEDDAVLNETIQEFIAQNGHRIDGVQTFEEAEDKLYENRYDVIILDVNLPDGNGFDFLLKARNEGLTTPAIFLTSRDRIEDLEEGFHSGADDYLRKPFELKELLLRVEMLLKRGFFHEAGEEVVIDEGIVYDVTRERLIVNRQEIRLGKKEGRLLKLFIKHNGEILSHERIFDYVWDYDETPSDAALRTYIKNLRKHIGKDKIVSFKKQGYRFVTSQ